MTLSEVDAWYYPIADLKCPICDSKKTIPKIHSSRKMKNYRNLLRHIVKPTVMNLQNKGRLFLKR